MARNKDLQWNCGDAGNVTIEQAHLAVLMDIRDELKRLNGTIHCHNFLAIPRKLDEIRRNTAKPRKKKKNVRRKKA